jgi:hypothetical protein
MRCAECGLYECCMRTPLGGCPNGEKVESPGVITTPNTNPFPCNPWWTWREPDKAAEIVRKNAEPPVSREKFERRKKVWMAHEKAVLEPFLSAAQDLVDAVERYVEPKPGQEFVHRSEILLKKNALKAILK